MTRAVLPLSPSFYIVDGKLLLPDVSIKGQALVKGDQISYSIAAASILAKETRDRIMKHLAKDYPQYGWERNAGYGTPQHKAALIRYGITPHHRKSYAPIKRLYGPAISIPHH
jgi:ribonuclease HII